MDVKHHGYLLDVGVSLLDTGEHLEHGPSARKRADHCPRRVMILAAPHNVIMPL